MVAGNGGNKKLVDGAGLMVIAPAFVMVGAAAVVALSTPVMFPLMVTDFASAILFAASLVTRQTPAPDNAVPGQPAQGRTRGHIHRAGGGGPGRVAQPAGIKPISGHAPATAVSRRCLCRNRRRATSAHNASITVMG